jgi:hypothetical protein
MALSVLEEYAKELQLEGYEFNTDEQLELVPNVDNEIVVNDFIRVTAYSQWERYTLRGNRVYDLTKRTYKFDKPIKVTAVYLVPFEDLPLTLQRYVAIRSARVFANRVIGAGEQNNYNQEDEVRARIAWLNTVSEDMDLNVLSNQNHVSGLNYRPYQAMIR